MHSIHRSSPDNNCMFVQLPCIEAHEAVKLETRARLWEVREWSLQPADNWSACQMAQAVFPTATYSARAHPAKSRMCAPTLAEETGDNCPDPWLTPSTDQLKIADRWGQPMAREKIQWRMPKSPFQMLLCI